MRKACVLVPIALLASRAQGAEAGDFDGDGRLSIGDLVHLGDGKPPAPGAVEGFWSFPCYHPEAEDWMETEMPAGVYLEALRRGVEGSLPGWDSVWDPGIASSPLPRDPGIRVAVLPASATGRTNDRVPLVIVFEIDEPVRAFSLVLESPGGILRPVTDLDIHGLPLWQSRVWRQYDQLGGVLGYNLFQDFGDDSVSVSPQTYLITGGRYVMAFNPSGRGETLAPGTHRFVVEARLPAGTPVGIHEIEVHPASELVLSSGSIVAPSPQGLGRLVLEEEVTEGWDEGVPPLRFDVPGRKVLGNVEFRLTRADGTPTPPGEPVAEGFPGDPVRLRMQMRTETPLNELHLQLLWRNADLQCDGEPRVVFTSPEDGRVYEAQVLHDLPCASDLAIDYGRVNFTFRLAGSQNFSPAAGGVAGLNVNYPDRPLEYFKPLDRWIDLVELDLRIEPDAAGGATIPLEFLEYERGTGFGPSYPDAAFIPYDGEHPCHRDLWPPERFWSYDVSHEDAFVRVLGSQEPPPPADLGIRVDVGETTGRPGNTVRLPITASNQAPLSMMRLAFELDSSAVVAEAFELLVKSGLTGDSSIGMVEPGRLKVFRECIDSDGDGVPECFDGEPKAVFYRETPDGFVVVDIFPSPDWPGPGPLEIGRLTLRIRGNAEGNETRIAPGTFPFDDAGNLIEAETGGLALEGDGRIRFSPASEVDPGRILFEGRGFLRGDSNRDERVDLSDAIATLAHLFLGTVPLSCLDAADANDDSKLEITDPVYLLGVLFLGAGAIPEPFPSCGHDPTDDPLGCLAACP